MKKYRVQLSVPCKNNNWQATLEERIVEAENLNCLLTNAVSIEEYKNGCKIISIYEYTGDRYNTQIKRYLPNNLNV